MSTWKASSAAALSSISIRRGKWGACDRRWSDIEVFDRFGVVLDGSVLPRLHVRAHEHLESLIGGGAVFDLDPEGEMGRV